MDSSQFYEFGEFRLDAGQKLLFRRGELVPLTPKSIEILQLLVENHGRMVDKDQLLKEVWPDTFVEEGSLTRNISFLRKALGEGQENGEFIETIPKRGYRFVAPVVEAEHASQPAPTGAPALQDEVQEPGRARRLRFVLPAVGLIAVLLGAAIFYYTTGRPALAFARRDWVLVGDFENQTGDARFDKALLTAFTASLEQSKHANIYPRSRMGDALRRMGKKQDAAVDEAVGREVCQRENVRGLVSPTITRTGQQFELVVRLIDPQTGVTARTYQARARGEDQILDTLEGLVSNVRQGLGESLYSIRQTNRPLARVTTPSLKALKDYTDGTEAWRKGNWKTSVELLNLALAADPDFAMAHVALGSSYASHIISKPQDSREHYEKALQLEDRISDREQAYTRVSFARSLGHSDEAIRLSLSYLESYPDDVGERFNLANVLRAAQREDEAIVQFKELLRIDPRDAKSLINLATLYSDRGQFNDAVTYYQKGFEVEPQWITFANLNNEYGFTLVGAGQEVQAREIFERTLQGPERHRGLRSLALLDMYHGKYRQARTRLEEAIQLLTGKEFALQRARNFLFLAMADQELGERSTSQGELKKAAAALSEYGQFIPWLGARIAVNYARVGDVDAARSLLTNLRSRADLQSPDQAGDLNWLEAEIEIAGSNPSGAVTLLEQAERPVSRPLTLDALANANARAGSNNMAIAAYEKLLSTQGGRIGWEAQLAWLTAHTRLASLYLARAEKDKAAKTLDALLDLWKDADPELLSLREARRLRSLIN